MNRLIFLTCYSFFTTFFIIAQSPETLFSKDKMREDLELFKKIRVQANSGLYKYRTTRQIDSIYTWAYEEIDNSYTYLDFYKIICKLTDFEGSLHNYTRLSTKMMASIKDGEWGYFPFPLKLIENKMLLNYENDTIRLGSEILSVNGIPITEIVKKLYKFTTTDGTNITGKFWEINRSFSEFFRFEYGPQESFEVVYIDSKSKTKENIHITGTSYERYYERVKKRHSKIFDENLYRDWSADEIYSYQEMDAATGKLTIHSFNIGGNETSSEHLKFVSFLDSVFSGIKKKGIKNLIVDVRSNGGGTDPNDLATYSYLAQRDFSENKEAWISFKKIPLLQHIDNPIPAILRPLFVGKHNKYFRETFKVEKDGKYYQDENSFDHQVRHPNKNAFTGTIYLLIGPAVASAGSLFAAMVAGNDNTVVIGQETMGGYYGHNGHIPLTYILPKSKIRSGFSIVNLRQDVPEKSSQRHDRGIFPDFEVGQTYGDFIKNVDTQMKYTLDLIENKK